MRRGGQAAVWPDGRLLPALRCADPGGECGDVSPVTYPAWWALSDQGRGSGESSALAAPACFLGHARLCGLCPLTRGRTATSALRHTSQHCASACLCPAGGLGQQHLWHPGRGRKERLLLSEICGGRTRTAHTHQVGPQPWLRYLVRLAALCLAAALICHLGAFARQGSAYQPSPASPSCLPIPIPQQGGGARGAAPPHTRGAAPPPQLCRGAPLLGCGCCAFAADLITRLRRVTSLAAGLPFLHDILL